MILLDNLTKEYDLPTGKAGQLVAADRLTLEVPAGEVFGLVGPNGAGKTTTLKMICGLMLPTAGRISVNNIDVEKKPEEAQRYIGYLADFFSVYHDLKAWEYVEHFAMAYKLEPAKIRERAREVIGVLGLESKYDAMVGTLSRGMKQRLGIARAIVHCAALSIVIGYASSHQDDSQLATGPYGWGLEVLKIAFWLQALMLAAGGGIACINSIHREKEQNTFDYQRVTRMSPLELALGKLFGAPVFTYFVFLCLMPLALFGAVMGKRPALTVLAAYAVLLVASLAVHMLALLISLLTVRGSQTAAILVLLVLLGNGAWSTTRLKYRLVPPLGPFTAVQIAQWGKWTPTGTGVTVVRGEPIERLWEIEMFFGHKVSHVPVQLALDLMFAGWFLLALVRNIKRDPNYYEILFPHAGSRICDVSKYLVRRVFLLVGHAPTNRELGDLPEAEYRRLLLPGSGSGSQPGTRAKDFTGSRGRRCELARLDVASTPDGRWIGGCVCHCCCGSGLGKLG